MIRTTLAALCLFGILGGAAYADQSPIRLIVPFDAGGPTDQNARLIAAEISKVIERTVIVENKPGAAGIVGAQYVAKAPADGTVYLIGSNASLAINKGLYKTLPYDPQKDFAPVGGISFSPLVLAVNKDIHAKTVEDFVVEAKARKEPLTMGSSGSGSIPHIAGSYIADALGVSVLHIPFKGTAPAVVALMSGTIDIIFDTLPTSLQNIKAGQYNGLGITSDQRFPLLPDVPTFKEQGYDNMTASAWFGLVAPAKTPPAVIAEMNKALNIALGTDVVKEKFLNMGAQPMLGSPAEFTQFVQEETDKWVPQVKRLGLTVN
ncbi:MAG: tripartite tricarboxylate transporter substrate binding protein [Pusillimonas sp.]